MFKHQSSRVLWAAVLLTSLPGASSINLSVEIFLVIYLQLARIQSKPLCLWVFLTDKLFLFLSFRTTIIVTSSFLDAFQKVADIATGTRGKMRSLPSLSLSLCCLTTQTVCLSSDDNEESRLIVFHRKGYSSEI